jgi:hypothetical protein
MSRIRCFLLKPTGRVLVSLRRYAIGSGTCPVGGYHDTKISIGDEPEEPSKEEPGYITNGCTPAPGHEDTRWPAVCACGYAFREEDEWQRFVERLYARVDTGEEMTLRDAPAGAMWEADWFDQFYTPQGSHVLVVRTPGGEWCIDSQASNCTIPDDKHQEHHHCWLRSGEPPDVTVGKSGGETCGAGGGSILMNGYRGFLRAGWLEEC